MKKGLVDILFWIGLLVVLVVFLALAVIQQGAQNSIRPELEIGTGGMSGGADGGWGFASHIENKNILWELQKQKVNSLNIQA